MPGAAQRAATALEKDMAGTLSKALRAHRDAVSLDELTVALQMGHTPSVMKAIDQAGLKAVFGDLEPMLVRGALAGAKTSAGAVSIDGLRARVQSWAKEHSAELVRQTKDTSRDAISSIVRTGVDEGRHPRRMAQDIRSVVGLDERSAMAVERRRSILLEQLPASRAHKLADDYAEDLLDRRAENIARTESMTAVNEGRSSLWEQLKEEGAAPPGQKKEWDSSADAAVCATCRMMHGKRVLLGEPWVLPDGEQVNAPPAHPSCLPRDVIVGDASVRALVRRRYVGDIINIETSGGMVLPVTPNHPILTPKGWVAAKFIQHGDEVFSRPLGERVPLSPFHPNGHGVPASIEDEFESAWLARAMSFAKVPSSSVQFHGDGGSDGEVDVVYPDGLFTRGGNASGMEPRLEQHRRRVSLGLFALSCLRSFFLFSRRASSSGRCSVGRPDQLLSVFQAGLLHAQEHGLATVPWFDAGLQETSADGSSPHRESFGQSLLGDSILVELAHRLGGDVRSSLCPSFFPSCAPLLNLVLGVVRKENTERIAAATHDASLEQRRSHLPDPQPELFGHLPARDAREVERTNGVLVDVRQRGFVADLVVHVSSASFSGAVFNMESREGWYTGNGIVTSNCRCSELLVNS